MTRVSSKQGIVIYAGDCNGQARSLELRQVDRLPRWPFQQRREDWKLWIHCLLSGSDGVVGRHPTLARKEKDVSKSDANELSSGRTLELKKAKTRFFQTLAFRYFSEMRLLFRGGKLW